MNSAGRARNRRGEGELLRADIVAAARKRLEDHGTEAGVTLRGVAREVGITAPAIYPHFPDVESLVQAVIVSVLEDLSRIVDRAYAAQGDDPAPLDILRARCQAYIEFGHRQPASYQILFTRPRPSAVPAVGVVVMADHWKFVETINDVVPHLSAEDARLIAISMWAALHGLASLPPHHPRFPWPDLDLMIERLLVNHFGADVVGAHPPRTRSTPHSPGSQALDP